MPKTHAILLLIIFNLLCFTACKKSEYELLKSELQKDLKWYDDTFNYCRYEEAGLNIDSFANETEKKLTKLLTYKESLDLNIKELPNVELQYSLDSLKKIYSFYYSISCAKGYISTHSIIQWKNEKDSILAVPISEQLYYSSIDTIYKLKSQFNNLYMVSAWNWYNNIFYVLQFEEDSIKFDYPAFYNRPYIIIDKSQISYDDENNGFNETTQVFSVGYSNYGNNVITHKDEPIADTLNNMIQHTGLLQLKFNGKNFNVIE